MKPSAFRLAFAVAPPALLLLLCATQAPVQERANVNDAPRRVADVLDGVIQPRFQDDGGEFGITRLGPLVSGHRALGERRVLAPSLLPDRPPRTDREHGERQAIEAARALGSPFVVGFLHIGHRPGRSTATSGPTTPTIGQRQTLSVLAVRDAREQAFFTDAEWAHRLKPRPPHARQKSTATEERERRERTAVKNARLLRQWEQTARRTLPQLRRGQSASVPSGDYTLEMRPVRAAQSSCLSCHTGATPNETLGVMVYAIAKRAVGATTAAK